MPGVCRLGDIAVGTGSHGAKCCPHAITGHYINGAVTVRTNGRSTQRFFDILAVTCPHGHMGMSIQGSSTVLAEGKGVTRMGDTVSWFCGVGVNVMASTNVFAGDKKGSPPFYGGYPSFPGILDGGDSGSGDSGSGDSGSGDSDDDDGDNEPKDKYLALVYRNCYIDDTLSAESNSATIILPDGSPLNYVKTFNEQDDGTMEEGGAVLINKFNKYGVFTFSKVPPDVNNGVIILTSGNSYEKIIATTVMVKKIEDPNVMTKSIILGAPTIAVFEWDGDVSKGKWLPGTQHYASF